MSNQGGTTQISQNMFSGRNRHQHQQPIEHLTENRERLREVTMVQEETNNRVGSWSRSQDEIEKPEISGHFPYS